MALENESLRSRLIQRLYGTIRISSHCFQIISGEQLLLSCEELYHESEVPYLSSAKFCSRTMMLGAHKPNKIPYWLMCQLSELQYATVISMQWITSYIHIKMAGTLVRSATSITILSYRTMNKNPPIQISSESIKHHFEESIIAIISSCVSYFCDVKKALPSSASRITK